MKIVFVMAANGISPTGGFRIIAGYADRLAARGHEVTLVAPGGVRKASPKLRTRIRNVIRGLSAPPRLSAAPFLKNPNVRIVVKPGVAKLEAADFSGADILIGTWWETAEWMASAADSVAKLHFVQGHELFPYLPVERVADVYKMTTPKIVVSQWLRGKIEAYGGGACTVVENAVDAAEFAQGARTKPERPTVGFLYSLATIKNSAMAIDACRQLKAAYPDLQVIAFGSHKARPSDRMPPWIEYKVRPSAAEMSAIYGACDAWLFTSDEEGFGLPILEAMAAGTPVVATPAGAAPQIVNASNGALVAHDPADVAAAAALIINSSPETWAAMSIAALETALARNWDAAADRFEAALRAAIAGVKR